MREPRSSTRWVAVLAVVLATLGLTACAPDGGDPTVAEQGYQEGSGAYTFLAPDERPDAVEIAGQDFAGNPIDLADWRGEVVVLNFWYAACPPCRAEAPDLVAVADAYAEAGVRMLGVNHTDDAPTADAFAETYGVTYPSLDDSGATAVAALEGLVPLRAMPTTVVLDEQGRPAAVVVGLVTETTLSGLVDDVLAEG